MSSYLNKKKFHPGTFENIEEVWKRDEEKKENERKALEREKKLKEEKQEEELIKLKIDAGLLPENSLQKLDFIYKDTNELKTKEMDELSKPLKNEKNKDKDQKQIIPLIDDSLANTKQEMFVRMHEDPLYMMKKDE